MFFFYGAASGATDLKALSNNEYRNNSPRPLFGPLPLWSPGPKIKQALDH